MRPVTVLVHSSESRHLIDGRNYAFAEFEAIARNVAHAATSYDKTRVTVTFDTGDQYSCRLDLGQRGNDLGFQNHITAMIRYFDSPEGQERRDGWPQAMRLNWAISVDLARKMDFTPAPTYAEEATPQGLQLVIPGCEKIPQPKRGDRSAQLSMF